MRDGLPVWCWWVIGCVGVVVTLALAWPDLTALCRWYGRRHRRAAPAGPDGTAGAGREGDRARPGSQEVGW